MKCDKCGRDFPEPKIHDSHDVPCYLFSGFNRKQKKQKADKFPRHWLCSGEGTNKCHERYEEGVRLSMKARALDYSKKFFGGKEGDTKQAED